MIEAGKSGFYIILRNICRVICECIQPRQATDNNNDIIVIPVLYTYGLEVCSYLKQSWHDLFILNWFHIFMSKTSCFTSWKIQYRCSDMH